jgi:two-component system NtrC family response regulator
MILVIDDDIAVRTSLLLLFEKEGFAVHGVDGKESAIQFLENETPSLVILDLNFSIDTSGVEGMELLRMIRRLHPLLPVILITGWASIELAVQGMKLGANDFINKPWNNSHLLQSVRTFLTCRKKNR